MEEHDVTCSKQGLLHNLVRGQRATQWRVCWLAGIWEECLL